ncbi:hypothetical protein KFE25_014405 [Diacronema lutheri]|uniref:G protein gamma domain-containing protein n=2 Tax=Diacronema lutheri TaxID=2081491 RepID=A0A8J5XFE9_DIALT|nr:hypothetical protein KFE25_014405 [Diacronema lutheri]
MRATRPRVTARMVDAANGASARAARANASVRVDENALESAGADESADAGADVGADEAAHLRARVAQLELELETARAALQGAHAELPARAASPAQRIAALDGALAALEMPFASVEACEPALAMYAAFASTPSTPPRAGAAARQPLAALARAAAHNVAHAVRREAASSAEYIRSTDEAHAAASAAGVDGALLVGHELVLVLDNVRSAYNVGSLLRTADTARVHAVLCCGYTPCPPHAKIDKTAFAASRSVRTRHYDSTAAALRALRAKGFEIWAMETTARSLCYASAQPPPKLALVLGNEEVGVDPVILDDADKLVEIPTFGLKNSLNVASAAPVVVFDVLRQWGVLDDQRRETDELRSAILQVAVE